MTGDRVQLVPGRPRIFAVQVTTTWTALPAIPGNTYTVLLKHRASNTAAIYVADHITPTPGGLDRIEFAVTDGVLPFECDNTSRLYVRSASGTQVLEISAQMGQLG